LYLAIDTIPFSKDAMLHESSHSLGDIWAQLFDKKEAKKNAKYRKLLEGRYSSFFEPSLSGGDLLVDVVTGEHFAEGETPTSLGDLEPIRQTTKEQIELGRVLKDTDSMVVSDGVIPYWQDRPHIQPLGIGVHYYFVKKEELEKMKAELRASADKITVVTLNGKDGECDFLGMVDGIDNAYQLEFYGGNGLSDRSDITFEEMCERNSDDAFQRLGVLRMDVDNLGHIFQSGISSARSTLSRMSALSRSFDYFFSGYLNTIWRDCEPDRSFIIYSGGDDLFVIGSWDTTLRLSERIHKDFRIFTCENPAFSISGGVSIVGAKFPIMKGAEFSHNEESNAKKHTCAQHSKNSLSFLGSAFNFDLEFPQVKGLKDELVSLLNDEALPKSFISKVLQLHADAKFDNHEITEVKTYWMSAYTLGRMLQRAKEPARTLINTCKNEICTNAHRLNGKDIKGEYHPLELWAFACRWAELETRTEI